nr:hypothetical protein [uncultured Psychroserpens sp.]
MNEEVLFKRRPIAQTVDYRPIWKIGQLLLIIRDGSSTAGSSLLKLHLFSWVFQSYKNKEKLIKWIISDFESEMSIWTLSPHVNRAIAFAIGENLLKETKGKYTLTSKGNEYLTKIDSIAEAYSNEKKVLNRYGKIVSDSKIDKLAKDWK